MSKLQLRHDHGRHASNPFFGENNPKAVTSIEKGDNRNHINGPPLVDDLIKNLSSEITILNYKNNPINTQETNQKRATLYFRSHIDKRLIGAFVTLRTFQNQCVTQKQVLDRFPHLKKPFVSIFFRHCVAEGWFNQRPSDFSNKIFCYEASNMVLKSSRKYYEFCVSSRDKLEFI